MNETLVTLSGWVGSDVDFRTPKDISVASFRVGVTPRVKRGDNWENGETAWYSVTAWRTLAEHVRESIHKGEPVIVHGRLRTSTYAKENGETVTTLEVDATQVGHDLSLGTSAFLRARRSQPAEPQAEVSVVAG
jgi:single-strand DNA-binding protein